MQKNQKKLLSLFLVLSSFYTHSAFAAIPPQGQDAAQSLRQGIFKSKKNVAKYKVSLRVGLKGQSPFSVNAVAKSGKKTYISQFSDDGQTETIVELFARKSQVDNKDGLYMDVQITKRVRGQSRVSERAQIFAPDNQEMEFGMNSKGRIAGTLSLAVMAHKL